MSEMKPDELLAQRFVDGVLPPADEERVREWLTENEAFRNLVDQLQMVRAAFPKPADENIQTPAGFASRVAFAARVERGESSAVTMVTRLTWAAALLLLLGLGLIAGLQITRSSDTLSAEDELKPAYNELLQKAHQQKLERHKLVMGPDGKTGLSK